MSIENFAMKYTAKALVLSVLQCYRGASRCLSNWVQFQGKGCKFGAYSKLFIYHRTIFLEVLVQCSVALSTAFGRWFLT